MLVFLRVRFVAGLVIDNHRSLLATSMFLPHYSSVDLTTARALRGVHLACEGAVGPSC